MGGFNHQNHIGVALYPFESTHQVVFVTRKLTLNVAKVVPWHSKTVGMGSGDDARRRCPKFIQLVV